MPVAPPTQVKTTKHVPRYRQMSRGGGANTPESYRSKGGDGNSSKNDTCAANTTHQDGVGGGEERDAVFRGRCIRLRTAWRFTTWGSGEEGRLARGPQQGEGLRSPKEGSGAGSREASGAGSLTGPDENSGLYPTALRSHGKDGNQRTTQSGVHFTKLPGASPEQRRAQRG